MYKYPWVSAFIFTMMVCGGVMFLYFIWKIFSFATTGNDWTLFSLMLFVFIGARFFLFEERPEKKER
jgi:predicted membrane channel-forming protein YqfA (hemolysin III family)